MQKINFTEVYIEDCDGKNNSAGARDGIVMHLSIQMKKAKAQFDIPLSEGRNPETFKLIKAIVEQAESVRGLHG